MTVEQNHPIAHMLSALHVEIQEIRRAGNTVQVEIGDGVRLRIDAGDALYKFLVATDVQLRDDSPARIAYRGQEVFQG